MSNATTASLETLAADTTTHGWVRTICKHAPSFVRVPGAGYCAPATLPESGAVFSWIDRPTFGTTTWLDDADRAQYGADLELLDKLLNRATKAQLVLFLANLGRRGRADERKRDLVIRSTLAMMDRWWCAVAQ